MTPGRAPLSDDIQERGCEVGGRVSLPERSGRKGADSGSHDVAVSSGSACTSASVEPSYVLKALGLDDSIAHASLRFTVGRFSTVEDVDYAAARVVDVVTKLRGQEGERQILHN